MKHPSFCSPTFDAFLPLLSLYLCSVSLKWPGRYYRKTHGHPRSFHLPSKRSLISRTRPLEGSCLFKIMFYSGICVWQKHKCIHPTQVKINGIQCQENSATFSISWALQKDVGTQAVISYMPSSFSLPQLCRMVVLALGLTGRSSPYSVATGSVFKVPVPRLENLIGAACIRCFPVVQSSVAWW